jgi:hypothetical protein
VIVSIGFLQLSVFNAMVAVRRQSGEQARGIKVRELTPSSNSKVGWPCINGSPNYHEGHIGIERTGRTGPGPAESGGARSERKRKREQW